MDDEHAVSRVKLHKEAKLALKFKSCMTAVEGCRSMAVRSGHATTSRIS